MLENQADDHLGDASNDKDAALAPAPAVDSGAQEQDYSPLDGEKLLERLQAERHAIRGRLVPHMDMSKLTWFRAGGPAELFFQPEDEKDFFSFLEILPPDVPLTMIGLGTNLLVRDGGLKGVVVRLSAKAFGEVSLLSPTTIKAGCGVSGKRLAAFALESGLGGFHFYQGIPGVLGGALRMNAGANGLETADRVVKVRTIDRGGILCDFMKSDMGYSYRHSSVDEEVVFLSAVLEGYPASKEDIQKAMDAVMEHREKEQPVSEKTGGSTFKNPDSISAWKAIDQAGCRGLQIRGAQMSQKHCNFMINTGSASAYDLELLGETVRRRVLDTLGISLEWEIKRLGQFLPSKKVFPFLKKAVSRQ